MRQLRGKWQLVARVIAIALCLFHLFTGVLGLLPSLQQRAVHVGLTLALVFLFYPARKSQTGRSTIPWWDILFVLLISVSAIYILHNYLRFLPFMVDSASSFELILAVVTTILIIEAGRRTLGWVFPILTALMFLYALFGEYIGGKFGHPHIAWWLILENVYLSANGIWGFLTGLSSTYIALFIIFGTFLLTSGAGQTFTDLSLSIAGRFRGGPAKVAVIASASFAMMSGSATANVATTGNFTIPMMKKLGYQAHFAGGVESTASTGGALTPPIMGSAAFVMAELLGIPYLKVVVAAIIPAFLFYVSVFFGVHLEAVKRNLSPVPRDEIPSFKKALNWRSLPMLVLPIGVLLALLFSGSSLTLAASAACVVLLILYFLIHLISNRTLKGINERLLGLVLCLEAGGKSLMTLVPMLVCANIVLSLLNFTGLGVKISSMIMGLSEANVVLSVVLTAILVMLLGTGLPITAAYILGAIIAGPMLVGWGLLPLAAHMLCLYYSVVANLTPPVCPAVFIAAAIAQSNWLKTAWVSLRLAPLLYFMPFLFAFDNSFLMMGSWMLILLNVSTAAFGAVILISGTMGQLYIKNYILESLLLVTAGILLLVPGWRLDLFGVVITLAILLRQLWYKKRQLGIKSV